MSCFREALQSQLKERRNVVPVPQDVEVRTAAVAVEQKVSSGKIR